MDRWFKMQDVSLTNKHLEDLLGSISHREMQIRTKAMYHGMSARPKLKTPTTPDAGTLMQPSHECKMLGHFGNLLLGIHRRATEAHILKTASTGMYMAALCIIAQRENNLNIH